METVRRKIRVRVDVFPLFDPEQTDVQLYASTDLGGGPLSDDNATYIIEAEVDVPVRYPEIVSGTVISDGPLDTPPTGDDSGKGVG